MLKAKGGNKKPGKMTVGEAGRMGGESTKRNHDHKFFEEIGKKGGRARAQIIREEGMSDELRKKYSEGGKKGGRATSKTHGKEFYREIGRKGGSSPKKKEQEDDTIQNYRFRWI